MCTKIMEICDNSALLPQVPVENSILEYTGGYYSQVEGQVYNTIHSFISVTLDSIMQSGQNFSKEGNEQRFLLIQLVGASLAE